MIFRGNGEMNLDDQFHKNILDNLYVGVLCTDDSMNIIYWNNMATEIAGYAADVVKGKPCLELFACLEKCQYQKCPKDCPLKKQLVGLSDFEADSFMRHKEGYHVPVHLRSTTIKDGKGSILGKTRIFTENRSIVEMKQKFNDLEKLATFDSLTGLYNRRYIEDCLKARLIEIKQFSKYFGIILMDIDHFKSINDVYGHVYGDKALKTITKTLSNCSRKSDLVGRFGGEEFIVLVNDVQDLSDLSVIANKFRVLVEKTKTNIDDKGIHLTVSLGATIAQATDSLESLVSRADKLLYKSKNLGRNILSLQ